MESSSNEELSKKPEVETVMLKVEPPECGGSDSEPDSDMEEGEIVIKQEAASGPHKELFHYESDIEISSDDSDEDYRMASVVTCKICKSEFINKDCLLRHVASEHLTKKKFECPNTECTKSFKSEKFYKLHLKICKIIIKSKNEFTCSLCGMGYNTIRGLQAHYERQHLTGLESDVQAAEAREDINSALGITNEPSQFTTEEFFDATKIVYEDKPKEKKKYYYRHTCLICSTVMSTMKTLRHHYEAKHPDQMDMMQYEKSNKIVVVSDEDVVQFKCNHCNEVFEDKEQLKKHKRRHKTCICDVCGLAFKRPGDLKDHFSAVHLGEAKYHCDICNKNFRARSYLVQHKKIHDNPRSFICDVCGKAFNVKGNLTMHNKIVHLKERNHQCTVCGERFAVPQGLRKHMNTHDTSREAYLCDHCDLSFSTKSSLTRHMEAKHENKQKNCNICERSYNYDDALKKHLLNHHGLGASTSSGFNFPF